MARGRKPNKSQQRAERSRGLSEEAFKRFVAEAHAAKQELDDANMAHAGVFKKADGLGIHAQAVKLFLRLDKMEATKRTDFLRAFDTYRSWATAWTEQPDILDEDLPAANASEERFEDDPDAVGDVGEQDGEAAEQEPLAAEPSDGVAETNEGQPAPDADWGEDQPVASDAELGAAGFTFAAGRAVGAEGGEASANPHPEASPSHSIWLRGYAQGVADRETAANEASAESADEAERVVEMPRGRRARRSPPVDAGAVAVY